MKNKIIAKNSGFTLAELLIVIGILTIVFFTVAACGWGLAFAFSVKVLVPWLGIPAAWAHAGALGLSFALTGVSTIIIFVILAILVVAGASIARARRR